MGRKTNYITILTNFEVSHWEKQETVGTWYIFRTWNNYIFDTIWNFIERVVLALTEEKISLKYARGVMVCI